MAVPSKKSKTASKPTPARKPEPAAKTAKKLVAPPKKVAPPPPAKSAAKPAALKGSADKQARPAADVSAKGTPARPAPSRGAAPARPAASARPADSRKSSGRGPTSKVAPVREVVKPVIIPDKPIVDKQWLGEMRDSLVRRREELLSVVRSNRDQLAEGQKDFADIGDRASGGFEDEIAAGLLSLESAQLDEIEEAIARIDKGQYGLCGDCQKAIPRKRLEILPFARRCLACEGQKERTSRGFGGDDEGDEDEGEGE